MKRSLDDTDSPFLTGKNCISSHSELDDQRLRADTEISFTHTALHDSRHEIRLLWIISGSKDDNFRLRITHHSLA